MALRMYQRLVQAILEQYPIGEPGQRIVQGLALQLIVGVLQGLHHLRGPGGYARIEYRQAHGRKKDDDGDAGDRAGDP